MDLVYLAPRTPIFVTLHIRSNGRGFFHQREEYAHALFQELDESGDGLLTQDEITAIPPAGHLFPVGTRNTAASASNLGSADADNDGQVTPEEFTTYVFRASGAPLQINEGVQNLSPGLVVDLFDRLDRDQDGTLSEAELARAARTLRLMDFDLDEQIDADEIRMPTVFGRQLVSANSPAGQASASLTLLQPINREHVDDSLIRQLVQLYDRLSPGPRRGRFVKDGRLSANERVMSDEHSAEYDANRDRTLDQQELRAFFAHPRPVAEIYVDFGGESTAPEIRSVVHSELPPDAPIRFFDGSGQGVNVQISNVDFQLVASTAAQNVVASNYQSFSQSDGDKNEYLDRNEFANAIRRFDTNQFALVDTDGDGMVVEAEYDSFLKNQRELQKHVVSLNLASRGESLFQNVDATGDGRLDDRELAELPSRVLELDENQDGQLDRDELAGALQMVISRGNVDLQQPRSNIPTRVRTVPIPPARAAGNWFVKMDRNADGEVSKREFLGPLDVFEKLDADQNGRLSAKEAAN